MKILDFFSHVNQFENKLYYPYIIAESGVNHEGKMDLAKRLIDEAKEGGADAIKFQTYKAETIASRHSPAYWDLSKESTTSQYELFKKFDSFWKKEFEDLKVYCEKTGIEFLSTPFDLESARFLNDLMPVFKISSSDITNKPFIEYICKFGKPIILSTGAAYLYEIQEAVEWVEEFENPLALLHCVLNYPTTDEVAHLGMIKGLIRKFPNNIIGYSDHTLPKDMKTLETATLLGASILEKHFTFDKSLLGNDHYHAMDKEDLKVFKQNLERIFTLLGEFKVTASENEQLARKHARRSLVTKQTIAKDQIITKDNVTWKRPANGICPKFISDVVGERAAMDIKIDTVLQWYHLQKEDQIL
jgi:sialic acid synthase SpsE